MRDSSKTEAEQAVQREFRKSWLITATLLSFSVLLFRVELNRLPNRIEMGPRTARVALQPVALQQGSDSRVRVVGAWRLLTDDPRFGGLSGLAVDGGDLLAITDSGVVARFEKPRGATGPTRLDELPGGPKSGDYKVNRDAEALTADPQGRGWWVAFENRNEVWLYDRSFSRSLASRAIDRGDLGRNRGIEGMIGAGSDLLLFPERGRQAFKLGEPGTQRLPRMFGWVSDAARLPDGQIVIINRRPTPIGLDNRLMFLKEGSTGLSVASAWKIPLGRLDNVEGIAAESLPDGRSRLWLVTDNNLQRRRPTLLIAIEVRPRPFRR